MSDPQALNVCLSLDHLVPAGITETPDFEVLEDLPQAPALPAGHPLNAATDCRTRVTRKGEEGEEQDCFTYTFAYSGFEYDASVGDAIDVYDDKNAVSVGRITKVSWHKNLSALPMSSHARRPVLVTLEFTSAMNLLGGGYRVYRYESGRFVLFPNPAVQHYSKVFKIAHDDGTGNYGHVAVYITPDNGNEVIGLFFVPPMESPPDDWKLRAQRWAAWNWNRGIRIRAPENSGIRTNPSNYVTSLLRDILNQQSFRLSDSWGVNIQSLDPLPPWVARSTIQLHVNIV